MQTQECPFCRTEIDADAVVCKGCGASYGVKCHGKVVTRKNCIIMTLIHSILIAVPFSFALIFSMFFAFGTIAGWVAVGFVLVYFLLQIHTLISDVVWWRP